MATRLFKSIVHQDERILAVDVNEIQKKYNAYGMYFIDENFEENLAQYREERKLEFDSWKEDNPDYTLADVKKFISEFQEEHHVDDVSKGCCDYFGRPTKFVTFKDYDDPYVNESNVADFYFDGEQLTPDDLEDYIEYFFQWDGSNFRDIYLTGTNYTSDWEEITDDYPSWEDKILLYNEYDFGSNATSWNIYYRLGTDMFKENCSVYQGWGGDIYHLGDMEEIFSVEMLYALVNSEDETLIQKYALDYLGEGYEYREGKFYQDGVEIEIRFKWEYEEPYGYHIVEMDVYPA